MNENLSRCLDAEYWYGFGFQFDSDDNSFIIARISPRNYDVSGSIKCAEITAFVQQFAKMAKCFEWLGRKYVQVDYTEWEHIPLVFQSLIDRGDLNVCPHSKLDANFKPGDRFSRHLMEQRKIEQFKQFATEFGGLKNAAEMIRYQDVFCEYFNWHSSIGKSFCAELRLALSLPLESDTKSRYEKIDSVCRQYKILHRGVWSAHEPFTVLGKRSSPEPTERIEKNKRDEKKQDEEDVCVICMEEKPNTLVLPCMCSVVCQKCSKMLENTNDKDICVKCRRKFQEICS